MLKSLTLGAAVVAAAAILTPASAGPAPTQDALVKVADGGLLLQAHYRHRYHHHHHHCRRVCVGQMHYSHRFGHWHCHGYWATRCN
jgi:hypothetical protein